MKSRFLADERGVEPTALKIMAGVIMLAIGLSIGVAVYKRASGGVSGQLSFSVATSPSSLTENKGDNKNVTVTVTRILDYSNTVSLSADNVTGVYTVDFYPTSGVPTFSSTMTVRIASAAPSGTRTITIKATGTDGTQQSGSLELTVA